MITEIDRKFKEYEFDLRIIEAKNGFLVSIGNPARFSDATPREIYVAYSPIELGHLIKRLALCVDRWVDEKED